VFLTPKLIGLHVPVGSIQKNSIIFFASTVLEYLPNHSIQSGVKAVTDVVLEYI
jgi:hypothetical protein